jgi:hypothetical protein
MHDASETKIENHTNKAPSHKGAREKLNHTETNFYNIFFETDF